MFGLFKKYFKASRLISLATFADVLHRRIVSLEVENAYITEQLHKHEQAAGGGFWKTASGYILRIRDMSTDHINRCLAGNFAKSGGRVRDNMESELRCRDEEAHWRRKPMPDVTVKNVKSPEGVQDHHIPEEKDYNDGLVGLIVGIPVYVDKNISAKQIMHLRAFIARTLRVEEDKPKEADGFVGIIDGTPVYVDKNIGMVQRERIEAFIRRLELVRVRTL